MVAICKNKNNITEEIDVTAGAHQVYQLSNFLFNLFINDL